MLYPTVQRRLGRRAKEKRLGVEDRRTKGLRQVLVTTLFQLVLPPQKIRSSPEFRSLWLVEVSSSGSKRTPLPTKPLLQVLYRWRLLQTPSSVQQLIG
ncbi:hypothetical protein DY000_02003224 [Brassica cretica]|uniref:Uncharacterized protein n=1 Tax=Brassica cretica TaxID=69181 RepID=A0ABQ7BXC3_BRACR|nr:hypothetical protein DY000_02003224 [Brassica cretica]